jgi:hypothetical protein
MREWNRVAEPAAPRFRHIVGAEADCSALKHDFSARRWQSGEDGESFL